MQYENTVQERQQLPHVHSHLDMPTALQFNKGIRSTGAGYPLSQEIEKSKRMLWSYQRFHRKWIDLIDQCNNTSLFPYHERIQAHALEAHGTSAAQPALDYLFFYSCSASQYPLRCHCVGILVDQISFDASSDIKILSSHAKAPRISHFPITLSLISGCVEAKGA